jgi:hypothetical protein
MALKSDTTSPLWFIVLVSALISGSICFVAGEHVAFNYARDYCHVGI